MIARHRAQFTCMALVLALLFGALCGEVRSAMADRPRTVGCYAKGGLEVAGVCISRKVIIQ